MTTIRRRQHHLGPATALFIVFFLLCTGTPGFSAWSAQTFRSEAAQQRIKAQLGPQVGTAAIWLADINRDFRLPISSKLNRIERLFRIRQTWALYTNGPNHSCRLEAWVEDELVYRTRDAQHRWMAPQLEHRKLRPMVDSVASKANAFNWRGMGRFLVNAARRDFPEAQSVTLVATRARFGLQDTTPTHGHRANAETQWQLQSIPVEQLPDSTP